MESSEMCSRMVKRWLESSELDEADLINVEDDDGIEQQHS